MIELHPEDVAYMKQKEEAFWVYKRGKDGEYEVDKDTEKRKEKPVYRVSDM